MKFGIPKEILEGESRVAIVPKLIRQFKKEGDEIYIEKGAGEGSFFSDADYEKAGAKIFDDVKKLYEQSDVILKVQPPENQEIEMLKEDSIFIGFMAPTVRKEQTKMFADRKVTSFAMEFVPRISRAQSMDALSSMASIAGYRAVLIGAQHLCKFFPLLMTAAGTIPPAKVLILGAGVAGLQAIATARRLGANVEAFDTRPVVREQVESLGAVFVEMEVVEDAETKGGYAKEMSEAFIKKEMEIIGKHLEKSDICITTAQIFGKKAPILIKEDMVARMKPGSVIIDIAAEQGGNCELTEAGKIVEKYGVKVVGAKNLPATLPVDASQMYSKNIITLLNHLFSSDNFDFEDEITQKSCITHNGEVVNDFVKKTLEENS
ncbi:MAG: Re/Si-specific NAD(P)(+) transhydrogenase subunit alpha [Calditrichaeota bacterium]|nr:MAG: Re/Si-specific NAD(P)(+) transhydrogenase subunit alpha [Calditrichota bacterium]